MKPLRSKAPPSSILSASFNYVPAAQTDLRKRFAAIRKEQAAAGKATAEEQQRERDRARIVTNLQKWRQDK